MSEQLNGGGDVYASSFLTVVLRECGERTADAAFMLLQRVFPKITIFRVSGIPFAECMKRSFERGVSEGAKWTLCIDADVLVDPVGLRLLLQFANLQPESVFEIQGFVFDKFFGVERPAGNHLYRTMLLPEALTLIPAEPNTLRPETATIEQMRVRGYRDVQSPFLVGLHDFEQSYLSIATKAFLQAHKHNWLSEYLMCRWRNLEHDVDFQCALIGFEAGRAYAEDVFVDNVFLRSMVSKRISVLGVKSAHYEIGPKFDVAMEIAKLKSEIGHREIAYEASLKAFYYTPSPPRLREGVQSVGSIRYAALHLVKLVLSRSSRFLQRLVLGLRCWFAKSDSADSAVKA